jgi:hypothetical protein
MPGCAFSTRRRVRVCLAYTHPFSLGRGGSHSTMLFDGDYMLDRSQFSFTFVVAITSPGF